MPGVRHDKPSLSKSALLLSPCIAWADPDNRWYDESKEKPEDTEKRDAGTRFHELIDQWLKSPSPPSSDG